ncbi:MAG: preprotein translocase subunit SecY [Candidatus Omnitrophica bacterium]|nr:preprotein translocase subunit SecY [Candidatus Omnitrophota bacterium]
MIQALANAFKIPELRSKILFTLGIVVIYRIGAYVPTPGIDGFALNRFFQSIAQTPGGMLFGIMGMFSGGALQKATIFALGIMPYISASIILQLLTVVIPHLEKLAKEGGEEGRRKIIQYTRYTTVILGIIQTFFISLWLENPNAFQGTVIVPHPGWGFRLMTILTLTTGTAFIMWLGEQIDQRGIGNGMSILITVGILESVPTAIWQTFVLVSPLDPARQQLPYWKLAIMVVLFVAVVLGVIAIIQGQRRIQVQYAKQVRGHRVYGGGSTYLPLKVNQAGVIPIIFAQSVILFPATIGAFIRTGWMQNFVQFLSPGHWVYETLYAVFILFFTFFYTAITFNPIDVSNNLQKYGGFIPGIRPGKNTAEHLDYTMTRIAFSGAVFLAVIALIPSVLSSPKVMNIPFLIASFFGGTGLLIIVGVVLDTAKAIESQLLMRHYEGFLKKGKIKGRR